MTASPDERERRDVAQRLRDSLFEPGAGRRLHPWPRWRWPLRSPIELADTIAHALRRRHLIPRGLLSSVCGRYERHLTSSPRRR